MTCETARCPRTTARTSPARTPCVEIAYGLANGVHTLIPSATAAVVVSIGSELAAARAARARSTSPTTWRATVANQVRDSDLPQQHADHLVAPFSAVGLHALLIVEAASSEQMPRRAHAIVQPLLDAGGILLDRALAVQERDRAVRRVVRLCQHENARGRAHDRRPRARRRIALARARPRASTIRPTSAAPAGRRGGSCAPPASSTSRASAASRATTA